MSATPRTDKAEATVPGFYSCATVPSRLARELELENSALREACQAFVDWVDGGHFPAKHSNPPTVEANMARAALARSGKGEV